MKLVAILITISMALATYATAQQTHSQPTIAEINRTTAMAIRYAIQGIPSGYATEKVGNMVIEARVEHTFYDSMASYIFRSRPCHRIAVKLQNLRNYYTACELGDGRYAVVAGNYSFDAIEKIRSGQIPRAFEY